MEKRNGCKFKLDIIVISAILILSFAALIAVNLLRDDGAEVTVSVDGKTVGSYSLSDEIETDIITENGKNVLRIKDGKAEIVFADCPDGICAAHRPVSKSGETIVCLPHKLVVRVDGREGER